MSEFAKARAGLALLASKENPRVKRWQGKGPEKPGDKKPTEEKPKEERQNQQKFVSHDIEKLGKQYEDMKASGVNPKLLADIKSVLDQWGGDKKEEPLKPGEGKKPAKLAQLPKEAEKEGITSKEGRLAEKKPTEDKKTEKKDEFKEAIAGAEKKDKTLPKKGEQLKKPEAKRQKAEEVVTGEEDRENFRNLLEGYFHTQDEMKQMTNIIEQHRGELEHVMEQLRPLLTKFDNLSREEAKFKAEFEEGGAWHLGPRCLATACVLPDRSSVELVGPNNAIV